jgi:hypothetical protein
MNKVRNQHPAGAHFVGRDENGALPSPPAQGAPSAVAPPHAAGGADAPRLVISDAKVEIGLYTLTGAVLSEPRRLTSEALLLDGNGEALDMRQALLVAIERATDHIEAMRIEMLKREQEPGRGR